MKNANVRKPKTVRQGDQTPSWSLLAPPHLDATPSKESATIQRKDHKQSDDEVPSAHEARAGEPPGNGDDLSKVTDSSDELSDQELAQLWEIHCALVGEHILTYAPGGALWQMLEGLIADLPVGPLLRMIQDITTDKSMSEKQQADLVRWIGQRVVHAVKNADAEFFLQLGTVLRARREGRSLEAITAKELGLVRPRGRKPQGSDLSRVFPLAVIKVTTRRHRKSTWAGEFTRQRITRNELFLAIRELRGVKNVIDNSELSRWITRYRLNPFMERA